VNSADAIGVYSLATHPSHRRSGYGEALLRAVVSYASNESGIDRVVLQSTEIGHSLYQRLGFRDATRYTVYLTN
jgi:ribosomal protein S18 acetylase RimI-like enzyme